MKIKKKSFIFELLPFANLDIENLFLKKNITASSVKLVQLIGDKE